MPALTETPTTCDCGFAHADAIVQRAHALTCVDIPHDPASTVIGSCAGCGTQLVAGQRFVADADGYLVEPHCLPED